MRETDRPLHRKRRFARLRRPVSDATADRVRLAIELRSQREGADEPTEEFVAGLRHKIAAAADPPAPAVRRRGLLTGFSIAAASAVTAVAIDESIPRGNDLWHRVAPAAALPRGGVRPFQVGELTGFVTRRRDGRLSAVSGACTHLGCRLALSGDATRLDCPCHSTSFAVTGEVVRKQLPIALPPLPRYEVRESEGHIEIRLPL